MAMWRWLRGFGNRAPRPTAVPTRPRIILAEGCLQAVAEELAGSVAACCEGIVYLLGRTDGTITVAVSAIRPVARTTRGSFDVDALAMARMVRSSSDLSLQVVGQVHTHPGAAYHSEGDVEGARIKYPGYASIVLPNYGRLLTCLDGAAAYLYVAGEGFVELQHEDVLVVPGRIR